MENEEPNTVDYHGTFLDLRDHRVLMKFEELLGLTLPLLDVVTEDDFGFVAIGNHVTQLGLYGVNILQIPDFVINLTSLRLLILPWPHPIISDLVWQWIIDQELEVSGKLLKEYLASRYPPTNPFFAIGYIDINHIVQFISRNHLSLVIAAQVTRLLGEWKKGAESRKERGFGVPLSKLEIDAAAKEVGIIHGNPLLESDLTERETAMLPHLENEMQYIIDEIEPQISAVLSPLTMTHQMHLEEQMELFHRVLMAEHILQMIGENVGKTLDEMYEMWGFQLLREYGDMLLAFEEIKGNGIYYLENWVQLPIEWHRLIIDVICQNL